MTANGENQRAARTGRPRVTMEAVGRMAGVSQVTVSRALSDPTKVSPATLRKIQDAIEATGFVPNALAGALASRRSKLVSALVPSITNIVYSSTIRAFGEEMRQQGYQILLSETGFGAAEEERTIATHLSRRPDAMLLTGIHHTAQARKMLLGAEIPVVEIWDITDSPIDACIGFSHAEAGRAVARHALVQGVRTAGLVSADDERAQRRKGAFAAEFVAGGGATLEATVEGGASLAGGRALLSDLIGQGFETGVIFCSSDLLAHGVLIEAQARGIDVPGQFSVIGFGDQDFAAHTVPALTTVRVDRPLLGRTAARWLLSKFDGTDDGSTVMDLGFEIVERESS